MVFVCTVKCTFLENVGNGERARARAREAVDKDVPTGAQSAVGCRVSFAVEFDTAEAFFFDVP